MDDIRALYIYLDYPLAMGALTLLSLSGVFWLVHLGFPSINATQKPLHRIRLALGLGYIHPVLLLLALTLFASLIGVLILGLFGLILDTLNATHDSDEYLFYVLRIGGLTGVLGAVVAFPFTLIRLSLSRESLFNDKINEATRGLYARRQVTLAVGTRVKDSWQDDIVQRNAAIDRLEGLAQEKPSEVPRIARLLSVYVRELSSETSAEKPPEGASLEEMRDWAWNLPELRSDMEKAAQTLGRLAEIAPAPLVNGEIDLRGTNLQRVDLSGAKMKGALLQEAHLHGADFSGAYLQGADLYQAQLGEAYLDGAHLQGADLTEAQLSGAQMKGTYLSGAKLTGAILERAQMQSAHLFGTALQGADLGGALLQSAHLSGANLQSAHLVRADLQGANLRETKLQGTDFYGANLRDAQFGGAEFDAFTSLRAASLLCSVVRDVNFEGVPDILIHVDSLFGDGSVTLPNGILPGDDDWPSHWPVDHLELIFFYERWRAWQATLPPSWDQPD